MWVFYVDKINMAITINKPNVLHFTYTYKALNHNQQRFV